ncbi:NRDE family protein [Rhizorhabdus dicambivorans]|uniref:NRDE family protein n=1 Tax=Rhizorhabdus dicambivorans TaxID=1850238 RepID=A0A2A4FW50_9SPHN|nr:NRDE family protein [Rhizorhabdus dicambivorans]ATE65581.1 hypothetical protein CMV14_15190 [Rhizorhabdus dicambivorans]PCE41924.1 hypothetical protein COO09_12945 [Rhizorhabdus dicambivorans]
MCVLALAWNAHPRWGLVVAGNRDEYHARPAAPLARWDDDPSLIAGRDLQSGGTWMGVSEAGRFAVVTNLRGHGGPEPHRPSRGALVTDLLAGADPDGIAIEAYNPVNLIALDSWRARFLSNRPAALRTDLAPGLYGLSNGTLDEPWPKTLRLKSILLEWLTGAAENPALLLDGLREEVLPDIGVDPDTPSDMPEPNHSPIFIRDRRYGTRCSSVVAIERNGRGRFIERRFDSEARHSGDSELEFRWKD